MRAIDRIAAFCDAHDSLARSCVRLCVRVGITYEYVLFHRNFRSRPRCARLRVRFFKSYFFIIFSLHLPLAPPLCVCVCVRFIYLFIYLFIYFTVFYFIYCIFARACGRKRAAGAEKIYGTPC